MSTIKGTYWHLTWPRGLFLPVFMNEVATVPSEICGALGENVLGDIQGVAKSFDEELGNRMV